LSLSDKLFRPWQDLGVVHVVMITSDIPVMNFTTVSDGLEDVGHNAGCVEHERQGACSTGKLAGSKQAQVLWDVSTHADHLVVEVWMLQAGGEIARQ
jgi:hypothetical protein